MFHKLNVLLHLITVYKKHNKLFKWLNLASFFKFSKVVIFFIQNRVNIEIEKWSFIFEQVFHPIQNWRVAQVFPL